MGNFKRLKWGEIMRTRQALYNILRKTGYANKEFLQMKIDECPLLGQMVVNPRKLTNDANELLHFYTSHNYLICVKMAKFSGGLLYYYKKVRD